MEIKNKPYDYYDTQDGRSGVDLNSNTLFKDLRAANIVIKSDWNALDVGCRNCVTLKELWKNYTKKVYGIDIGTTASNGWTKIPFRDNLVCEDVHVWEFPEEFFDLVTISHTLEHLYDPDLVVDKIRRSLKPDGILHCIVPLDRESSFKDYKPHLVRFSSHEEHVEYLVSKGFVKIFDRTSHGNSVVILQKIMSC